ncbi:MAG: ZIP family metal transporter [Thermoproteota archaeon]
MFEGMCCIWVISLTFAISLIALLGVLTLFLKEELMNKILLVLVAFSAGALIGGAFLHLMPEAILQFGIIDESSVLNVFLYLILGFCSFFILEQFIHWHHHHSTSHPKIMPFSYLVLISDGMHNFIDGLVMAASFTVSYSTGIATALAIALHEIPQELGDFGVLIYGGFQRKKALLLNYLSAVAVILGGITGCLIYSWVGSINLLLPFAAGNFIYIASTDLIPEIRYKDNLKKSSIRFGVFLLGIALMLMIKFL